MRGVVSGYSGAWRDRSGVVALEFALIAPVLTIFIMGTVEITNAIRLQAKLQVTAGQLAELVAGQSSVTTSPPSAPPVAAGSLVDLCNGAAKNLIPYPPDTLSADIVSLSNDYATNRPSPPAGSTRTTVNTYLDWESISSCATTASSTLTRYGAFPLANNPTSLLSKTGTPAASVSDTANLKYGNTAIIVQVQYSYSNVLQFFLGSTMSFKAYAVARPRSNATIQCTDSNGASCPASS